MSTDTTKPWRKLYPVHPCADVYPMMSDAEIDALAADIKEHGLQKPIVLLRTGHRARPFAVLDGRNRLEAIARLGIELHHAVADPENVQVARGPGMTFAFEYVENVDPATYVIGANIRRRHLTKEQQAELIVRTLEAGQSNDPAKLARSFSPTAGARGGSTNDPILAEAVEQGQMHGISKRTIQRARANVHGPKTTIEPTVTLPPPPPSTYEWVDDKNTELRKQVDNAATSLLQALDGYAELMTEPQFEGRERRTARQRVDDALRRIGARRDQVFGDRKPEPKLRKAERHDIDGVEVCA